MKRNITTVTLLTILIGLISYELASYTASLKTINFEMVLENPSFNNLTGWVAGVLLYSFFFCIIPLVSSLIFRKRWFKVYCITLLVISIIWFIPQIAS